MTDLLTRIASVCVLALSGLLLTSAPAFAVDARVLEAQARRVEVVQQVAPSVVAIFAPGGQGGGSGVLVSADGYTVTNFHVVQGLGPFMKCGLNDGNVYDAVLVGIDPTGDVALIKLLGREDFPYATVGDSDLVRVGDWAYAMGNPFLLATDFQPTVTYGIVSGVHRYQYPAGTFLEYTDCIQVDASINPGNSGGPLFSDAGELIGINGRGSFEKRGRVNSGAGYAISINQVMNFLDHLKSGRIVDHATLGATVTSGGDGAVYVSTILEQSSAFRRGLRAGDELVSFAGRPIGSVNQFKNVLGIYPKGWTVPLVYRRDGVKYEMTVQLRGLHTRAELTPDAPLQPQPGPEQPQPGPEDDPDGPPPGRPQLPVGHPPTRAEPPAEFAHLYVEKTGYANWYFNKLHRDRVMDHLRQLGDFSPLTGNWIWKGVTVDGQPVEFKLNDQAAAVIIAGVPALQLLSEDLQDLPQGTGGLIAAVTHFRQLMLDPEAIFTEFYYLGSEPLDGTGERVDVLITTRGTVTTRWYIQRDSGRLAGWDTALEEDADPCEIRVDSWFETGAGVSIPGTFRIQHAGEPVLQLILGSAEMSASTDQ